MQLKTVQMKLTGVHAGKNIVLNKRRFVNGICTIADTEDKIKSVIKYFVRSYQVEVTGPGVKSELSQPEPDSVPKPNERQAAIIAAVNGIEKEEWVELDTNPHPKVKDVATLMEDPTVTKTEICEVIETWLS